MAHQGRYVESTNKSGVWQHFLKEVGCPSNSAKCKTCGTVISTIGGTTSGLRKHVTNVHKGTVLDKQKPTAASQLQVFQRATVESAMSRMAALDGISFCDSNQCRFRFLM